MLNRDQGGLHSGFGLRGRNTQLFLCCIVSLLCCTILPFAGCSGGRQTLNEQSIRVLTYNIHHGEGIDGKVDVERIADVIIQSRADVVALQEVDRWTERTKKIDILTALSDMTGLTYAFGKTGDHQAGESGNGVLTRFAILQERNNLIDASPMHEHRSLMELVLDVKGTEVALLNTQLDSQENDSSRSADIEKILTAAKNYQPMPVILCGDFGDVPSSRSIKKIGEQLPDCWSVSASGEGFTVPSSSPSKRVDYIFVSRTQKPVDSKILQVSLTPVHASVVATSASDHLPLLVELKFASE
jgi:endonuclease/exonuclease/phosphatase family metal-dependent hydrolase